MQRLGTPISRLADAIQENGVPGRSRRNQTQRASVGKQFADGGGQTAALWKDFVLEFRLVGAEGVHRRNAPHGSVQFIKKLVGDARGNFGAVTPREHVFVGDNHAIRFPNGRGRSPPNQKARASEDR